MIKKITLFVILSLFFMLNSLFAGSYLVSSQTGFFDALKKSNSGDTILWKPGVYHNILFSLAYSNRVIQAEVPGKTIFTGSSIANIMGSGNIIEGFQFLNGNIGSRQLITVTGSNNEFRHLNIKGYYCTKYFVIDEEARFNTVSYCNFERRAFIGDKNIFSVLVSERAPGYNTIRYCSFKDFPGEGKDEGMEPVRIGLSSQGDYISRTTVEYCYFEKCNGDGEIVSHKSRQNVYRYNTFYNNPVGELTLRHGDEGIVYGNFFLNGMGGVRIKEGQDHFVFNNYFEGLSKYPVNLMNYKTDPLARITIAYNTIVNSYPVGCGVSGAYPPTDVYFANNIFYNTSGPLFTGVTGNENWSGNMVFGEAGFALPEGITQTDPLLLRNQDGYYQLSEGSPAIDYAKPGYPIITAFKDMGIDAAVGFDIMKQIRPATIEEKDIGCSEYSASQHIKPHVTEKNTGPFYLQDEDYVYLDVKRKGAGKVILDPPSGVYDRGTMVRVYAQPANEYLEFTEWEGNLTGRNPVDSLFLDGNKQITAVFDSVALNTVEFYVSGSGHVEVDPPGWHYLDSTWITLTAVPDPGHSFKFWSGNISETDNPLSLLVTKSVVGFANFDQNTGIRNMSNSESGFSVYPNPASGAELCILAPGAYSLSDIKVFDMAGRRIDLPLEKLEGNKGFKADISSLFEGIYMIHLRNRNGLLADQNQEFSRWFIRK